MYTVFEMKPCYSTPLSSGGSVGAGARSRDSVTKIKHKAAAGDGGAGLA